MTARPRPGSSRRRPPARWRAALGACLAVGVVLGLTAPASAHATLESTNPANGTALAKSPGLVILHFDEQVSITPTSIEVFNAAAKRIDAGDTRHVPNDSHSVETAVPSSLPAGGYVVTWRVVSADSHPVNGAFTFFIGAATGGGSIASEASRLLAQSAGSRTVGVTYGVVRFLAFAAAAVLLGGLLFATAIWPDVVERRSARLLIWGALAALFAFTALAFALQGVYGAGLGLSDALRSQVLRDVWHTRFGEAYGARLVLLALLVVPVRLLRDRRRAARTTVYGTLALLGIAVLATWAVADHASTGSLVWLAVPFDVVHLGAASIWLGGLVMTLVVVLPAGGAAIRAALPRFSQWALCAVVAVAATGVFAAWRNIGVSWGALTTTPYGKLVLYKAGGLLVLVALASISRTSVHGHLALPATRPFGRSDRQPPAPAAPSGPEAGAVDESRGGPVATLAPPVVDVSTVLAARRRLRGAVAAEILVGLVVLGLTAALVNARPAKQAYAAPWSTEVKAGPTLVNIVVDPAKAGPLALHLYILTATGLIDDVPEVDATMSQPAAGIAGLTVPIHPAGPGHYVAYGFDVPISGTWTLNVTVRTDNLDEYFTGPISVHIR